MNNKIFSGLEQMGFDDVSHLKIYKQKNIENKKNKMDKIKSLLYTKTLKCPVCGNEFKAISVKSSAYRVVKKDTDFFIRYDLINPYFYDVWLCNKCGYATMKTDFEKLYSREAETILKKITPKWKGREYPVIYDVHIAIERYKLSLLNYVVIDSYASKKAMNCLKLAWMYRLIDSDNAKEMELMFLKEALSGFQEAYYNEHFPIYGMDKFTAMYLIGELHRRTGNYDDALVWFSNVVTTPGVKAKLKDLARNQKDLLKEEIAKARIESKKYSQTPTEDFEVPIKKSNIFSKLFNK